MDSSNNIFWITKKQETPDNQLCEGWLLINRDHNWIVNPSIHNPEIFSQTDRELLKNFCESCQFSDTCSKDTKEKILKILI